MGSHQSLGTSRESGKYPQGAVPVSGTGNSLGSSWDHWTPGATKARLVSPSAGDKPRSCFAKQQNKMGPRTFLNGIHLKVTKEVTTFQEMCVWEAAQWEGRTQRIPQGGELENKLGIKNDCIYINMLVATPVLQPGLLLCSCFESLIGKLAAIYSPPLSLQRLLLLIPSRCSS